MSGSAVDYRKHPPTGATAQGTSRRVGTGPPATWSDMLRAAELDLSVARAQLERAAESEANGTARQVAANAASAASAAQSMGYLIRLLHERLEQVEHATGCMPQPESDSPRPWRDAPRMAS